MTTEQKALALVNEVAAECGWGSLTLSAAKPAYGRCFEALCRAIEAHEADKRAFSDACNKVWDLDHFGREQVKKFLSPFILPEPEPDPLVEACREANEGPYYETHEVFAGKVRQALAARGYKIERIDND